MRNEVDFAVAAEFVVVQHVLNKEGIRILASINKIENTYLVARTDRGIRSPSDLKGKRIGIRPQVSGRFYFGRFLELNGLNVQQVTVVDVDAADFVNAITNGEVDAVVTYPPYVDQMKERLVEGAVVWPIQSSQPGYSSLVSRDDWIAKHPYSLGRFLRSLAEAEEYYLHHLDEAKALVQKKLNYDDATMATNWHGSQFSLSLDQSIILAMEDEARWMISNNLTAEKQVPNFLDYIYEDALKAVEPEAVNIIR